ncbi:hypothetical protein [Jeotgalibacillus soli]|uniref:hypothetical protein n=1 Tax=Jeotgalibacillus soli TaxID=889306 RepID=UPI000596FBC0|nr:hypothetical protein [Jeotgalibacillus soli]
MKNEFGFAVYESIIGFSCVVMLCLTLLPFLQIFLLKVDDSRQKAAAWTVLYEQLQISRNTGLQSFSSIEREGVTYHVNWQTSSKLCVNYDANHGENKQECLQASNEGIHIH